MIAVRQGPRHTLVDKQQQPDSKWFIWIGAFKCRMSRLKIRFGSLLGERLAAERLGGSQKSEVQCEAGSAGADRLGELTNTNPSLQNSLLSPQKEADSTNSLPTTSPGARNKPLEAPTPIATGPIDSGTPKTIDEGLQQSQSGEWTTDEWTTDDETLNWLEQELAKQNSDNGPGISHETPIYLQNKADLTIFMKEKPRRRLIVPRRDDKVAIQRGFGGFTILPRSTVLDKNSRSFPPPSNAYYDLTTHGVNPKIHARSSKRVVANEISSTVATADLTRADGETRTLDGNVSGMLERSGKA